MQRAMTGTRGSNDQFTIKLRQESSQCKHSPRGMEDLPIYNPNSIAGRREMSRFQSSDKWVHLIPLVVFFCLFILWYLSHPVNLEIKDGRITAVHEINTTHHVNDTEVDLAILALVTPPNASVPAQTITPNNKTAPQPAF